MHWRDRQGNFNVGITHQQVTNAADASGARPLDPTVPGKPHTQPRPAGTDRHRSADALAGSVPGANVAASRREVDHALATKILDEAYRVGSDDDRATRRVSVPRTK
jgi:hypothetical protein